MRDLLGPLPAAAGDRKAAAKYIAKINRTLEQVTLSARERKRLYKQRAKWTPRAAGTDKRWNTVGTMAGRPKILRAGVVGADGLTDADRDDPLLKVIEQKFGNQRKGRV